VPALPLKADGDPPPKEALPWELEKDGSFVHKLKTDPDLEILETESCFGSKLTVPSAAFTGFPPLPNFTKTENSLPT
jgi:hypothetical protein